MIALLIMGFGIVALIQIPALVQKQWWRELIVFMVLWSAGFILSIMISTGITLPPITMIINKYIIGIFEL